jgi:hypothetical protein
MLITMKIEFDVPTEARDCGYFDDGTLPDCDCNRCPDTSCFAIVTGIVDESTAEIERAGNEKLGGQWELVSYFPHDPDTEIDDAATLHRVL